ncbi:hypothetical protein ACFPA8_09505 [Streptomyces ovatisporus]|uniref:Secreted protein n=1 Tax=Streptomyces ovatisporus TaxID=1128682 RepID=A0ABV9A587_9ACTN
METIDQRRRTKNRAARPTGLARTAVATLTVATSMLGALAVGSTPAAADESSSPTGTLTNQRNGQKMAAWDNVLRAGQPANTVDPAIWPHYTNLDWTLEPQEGGKYRHLRLTDAQGHDWCLSNVPSPYNNTFPTSFRSCDDSTVQDWIVEPATDGGKGVTISPRNDPSRHLAPVTPQPSWARLGLTSSNDSSSRWDFSGRLTPTPPPPAPVAKPVVRPVSPYSAKVNGPAHPAVNVVNDTSGHVGKLTVTLKPGPKGVKFYRDQEVLVQRENGSKVPYSCVVKQVSDTAECEVDLDLGQGESARIEAPIYTEGLSAGEIPSMRFTVGGADPVKVDFMMTE